MNPTHAKKTVRHQRSNHISHTICQVESCKSERQLGALEKI